MAVRKAVRAVKSTKSPCTFRSESYHLHRYLNNTIRLISYILLDLRSSLLSLGNA